MSHILILFVVEAASEIRLFGLDVPHQYSNAAFRKLICQFYSNKVRIPKHIILAIHIAKSIEIVILKTYLIEILNLRNP